MVYKMIYNTKKVFKYMEKESRAKGLGDNPLDLAFSCAEFRHPYG